MEHADDFAETALLSAQPSPVARTQQLDIRFTGTGSEYFRIWIVNLLLILVTLSLYLPFARARRIAYFQNNTLIGGDPLGFHAKPWKMFRGYLVVLLLGMAYWGISHLAPSFAWIALLVFATLWPLLWRASLQFRLRNTSWRGVRLNFVGDVKSAYLSMLPFFLPALVLAGMEALVPAATADKDQAIRMAGGVGLVMLSFVVLMPWLWARVKRYQHGGYLFAQERTELTAGAGRFYGLFLKTAGVSILVLTVFMVVIGSVAAAVAQLAGNLGMSDWRGLVEQLGGRMVGLLIGGVVVFVIYALLPLIVGTYTTSRMQNLLWSNTRSAHLRMHSALRFWPLLRVNLVNWLLILCTLGLYWPFAKVRATRLKLEAVSLEVDGDVDAWVSEAQPAARGVLGDAAGDFFGIDMGL